MQYHHRINMRVWWPCFCVMLRVAGVWMTHAWSQDTKLAAELGRQARAHVQQHFSRAALGRKLDGIMCALAGGRSDSM